MHADDSWRDSGDVCDAVALALVITLALPLCAWFTIKQRIKMKANIEVKRKTAEIYSAIEKQHLRHPHRESLCQRGSGER